MAELVPAALPLGALRPVVQAGCGDHSDVKITANGLLVRLCGLAPAEVAGALVELLDPLDKTLNHKLKSDAVKQDIDRNDDLVRSALRAIAALAALPEAARAPTCTPTCTPRLPRNVC